MKQRHQSIFSVKTVNLIAKKWLILRSLSTTIFLKSGRKAELSVVTSEMLNLRKSGRGGNEATFLPYQVRKSSRVNDAKAWQCTSQK